MAQTGYTPISLFYSTTLGLAPTNTNLVYGELAINIRDGKLYYKDNNDVVKVIAGTGGTGVVAGSNTQVQYNNNGVFGASSNFTFDGTNIGLAGGTANGVAYLNGSKVLTTGSALTFDGTTFGVTNNSAGSTALAATKTADGIVAFFRRLGGTYNTGMTLSFADTSSNEVTFNTLYSAGSTPSYVWQTASAEQMRLTSTGLGIGTSSPSYKLDIQNSGSVVSRLYNTSGNADVYLETKNSFGDVLFGVGGTSAYMYTTSSIPLAFYNAGIERMRIDSAGNLGLGVTPSAWGAGYTASQIGITGNTAAASNSLFFTNNGYFNGTNWIYQQSTGAAVYEINRATRSHLWYTAPSGTAGNPITFTQAMTLDASGNLALGLASAGGYRLAVEGGDSIFSRTDGTAAKIVLNNSEGNGAIAADGNSLIFYNASATTERMRIDSSGNVGIGTSSPTGYSAFTRVLQINGSGDTDIKLTTSGTGTGGNNGLLIRTNSDGSETYFWNCQNGAVVLGTNNTERMRIDSAGNVGIGTSSPSSFLNGARNLVVGSGSGNQGETIYTGSAATGFLCFADGTSGNAAYRGWLAYSHDVDALTFASAATERMRIDSSGNVGIGTSSPAYALDVASTTASNARVRVQATTALSVLQATNNSGNFYLGIDNSTGSGFGIGYGRILYSDQAYPMAFYTNDTERMRIDSSGNVGIGTSSPAVRLDLGGGSLSLFNSTGTQQLYLYRYSSTNYSSIGTDVSSGGITFTTGTSSPAERMRINSSGNVLMGSTSPVWSERLNIQPISTNTEGLGVYSSSGSYTGIALLVQSENGTPRNWKAIEGRSNGGTPRFYVNGLGEAYFNSTIGVGATPATSGAGVTFPATQSASSDANTLDDYEEGTWTPTLTRSTTGSTMTYGAIRNGYYTKIGNVVTIECEVQVNTVSVQGTGINLLTGLPFMSPKGSYCAVGVVNYNTAFDTIVVRSCWVYGGLNGIAFNSVANTTGETTSNWVNGGYIALQVTYQI